MWKKNKNKNKKQQLISKNLVDSNFLFTSYDSMIHVKIALQFISKWFQSNSHGEMCYFVES